jgi:hypothetical protein
MAQKTDIQLRQEAYVIRNENARRANTAMRVGDMLLDIIDNKVNVEETSATIPIPIIFIERPVEAGNGLHISYRDTGFDFSTTQNPKLFLFKWKETRKTRKKQVTKTILQGWKHPVDMDWEANWQGWKFFGGKQSCPVATENVLLRRTEWDVDANLKPMQKQLIDFNKYYGWREKDSTEGVVYRFDENVFNDPIFSLSDPVSGQKKIALTGKRSASNHLHYQKIQKFAFAFAVDNPKATKTNGLCPVIFGAMSEPIYQVLKVVGTSNPSDVIMTHISQNQKANVRRKNGF